METRTRFLNRGTGRVRGGVSLGSALTGAVVAIGAMALIGAAASILFVALDVRPTIQDDAGVYRAGLAAAAGLVAAQFLSYLWGGYTAGRMARGAGAVNGLLVPLLVIFVGAIALAIGDAVDAGAQVGFGITDARLPIDRDIAVEAGAVLAGASLLGMLLGGLAGGIIGAHWHSRLENRELGAVMLEDRAADSTRSDDHRSVITAPEGVRVLGPDEAPDAADTHGGVIDLTNSEDDAPVEELLPGLREQRQPTV